MNAPVRLITCDAPAAEDAYAVYAALIRAARTEPSLLENPLWRAFKSVAFERFSRAFEVEE